MRNRFEVQLALGAVPIERLDFPKTREVTSAIMKSLQWIFITPEINQQIFALLETAITPKQKSLGRKGMDLWSILVLGVFRLGRKFSYDDLHDMANHHTQIKQLMGRTHLDTDLKFSLTALKENIPLLTEELLAKINLIISSHGVELTQKINDPLQLKTDSYVYETNIHYPTDLNLAYDSARKSVQVTSKLAQKHNLTGWRKSKNHLSKLKAKYLKCCTVSRRGGANKTNRLEPLVIDYLAHLQELYNKVTSSLTELKTQAALTLLDHATIEDIHYYQAMLEKHIDLIERRLLKGETIPHSEKIFSIFESHSEWISKGKLGKPVEFGHRLLITSTKSGIIVDYKIMENRTDVEEVPELVERLTSNIGLDNIHSISFDKGFSSAANKTLLDETAIPHIILPKKGKLTAAEYEQQHQKEWLKLRHQHSAVESNINSLEHHGLDRCPDKGLAHYKAYAGLGILAYNLHQIGKTLQAKEAASSKRKKRSRKPRSKGTDQKEAA